MVWHFMSSLPNVDFNGMVGLAVSSAPLTWKRPRIPTPPCWVFQLCFGVQTVRTASPPQKMPTWKAWTYDFFGAHGRQEPLFWPTSLRCRLEIVGGKIWSKVLFLYYPYSITIVSPCFPSIVPVFSLYHPYIIISYIPCSPGLLRALPGPRSMLKHADIVLLDEPTNHLDQEKRHRKTPRTSSCWILGVLVWLWWLEHDWIIFPENIGNGIIIPIREFIFFRGFETTSQ